MKICRGIGRAKGIEGCGVESDKRQNGLCPVCLVDWMENTEAGKLYKIQVFDPRVEKKLAKLKREKDKKLKEDLTNWRNKLQEKVQEICRLIDIGQPCLALKYHAGQMHGGHIYAKGGNKTMSLNLHNIHRQSAQSNHSHNDDGLLRENLAEEYGQKYADWLSSMRQCPTLKFTNGEYLEFYRTACQMANELKRLGQTFDKEGRILLRNEINTVLGIYPEEWCVYNG